MSMETLLDPGRRIVQKKAFLEEWVFVSGDSPDGQNVMISLCSSAQTTLIAFLRHPEHRNSSILFLGNPRGLKIRLILGTN